MTDAKQGRSIGVEFNELGLREHRHDRVEAGRSRLMEKEPICNDAEQKAREFSVRSSIELGK